MSPHGVFCRIAVSRQQPQCEWLFTPSCTSFCFTQVGEILDEIAAMRMEEESSKCPQCFFFLPADTSDWSTLQKADCFSIFTKNMQLFFVCRMFFEELRVAADRAEAARGTVTGTNSSEISDPIALQMPRVRMLSKQRKGW